jgi:hypothetical protein
MDFLTSLGVEDLPEQQTRLKDVMARQSEDFQLNLGYDACLSCGIELDHQNTICCRSCHRVNYCSEECRHLDSNSTVAAVIEDGDESALGHTAVVCSLLKLCGDDEAVETGSVDLLAAKRRQAAQDRVQSEYESYPATLANVISEGQCYQNALSRASSTKTLVIHIIGASTDSELWDNERKGGQEFASAYAEALADLSERRGLDVIRLVFVGLECPKEGVNLTRPMKNMNDEKTTGVLLIQSFRGLYNQETLKCYDIPSADIVVFFNPGFTVPDYQWKETMYTIKKGTPFLSTTNTEFEGISDCQFLLDLDMIQTMPPALAMMFDLYTAPDDDEENANSDSFFSVNPFCGSRVRQSGTLGNDLFVKSRWILGGILDSFDQSKAKKDMPSKKLRAESNNKRSNPALI